MQLILRVTVLALCVLCALALPNFGNKLVLEPSLEVFKAQLQASKIDARTMTAAEKNCADAHNNRTQKISDKLIKQTEVCFETANTTMATNNSTNNATVTSIRKDVGAIQENLMYCSMLEDNTDFLNCITINQFETFGLIAQSSVDLIQAEAMRLSCLNVAIGNSKMEMTQSGSEYNDCLDGIRLQRFSQE